MGAYNIDININTGNVTTSINGVVSSMKDLDALVAKLNNTMSGLGAGNATATEKAKKSITDYAGSYRTLAQDIEKTRKSLLNEVKALEDLRKATTVSDAAMDKQIQTVKELEKQLRSQTSALKQYSSVSKEANTSSISLMNGFNQIAGAFGISAGIYGAVFAIKGLIGVIADFDLSQKKLQSILGVSGKSMKDISNSAIEVGSSSIFGAKGVSELQIELAKMGFTKKEIMDMQVAIKDLATATQEDLAGSAEVVANVIRSFQLSATDATMVVDVMGKAFNDSALDLSNFREAIKYVAPIAKQAGFSFKETTAMLEQLSNAGIKGSLAGTGLTNILSRLGNENSKFVKTIGHTVNGFDEFAASLIDLKQRGADLGDVFQLVDRRAAATFSILLDGVSTVEEFKKKLEEANGVMKEQSEVQMEALSNKYELLKNQFSGFILAIDSGNGVLSTYLKGAIDQASLFLGILTDITSIGTKSTTDNKVDKTLNLLNQLRLPAPEEFLKALEQYDTKKTAAKFFDIATLLATQKNPQLAQAIVNNLSKSLEVANSGAMKIIDGLATSDIDVWKKAMGEKFNETLPELIGRLNVTQRKELSLGKEGTLEYEKRGIIIDKLNKLYEDYNKTKELEVQSDADRQKYIKHLEDQFKQEKSILEIKKKIALEDIKSLPDFRSSKGSPELIQLINDDIEKKRLLTQSYSWDEIIRKQDYDSAIKIAKLKGEDTSDIINSYNLNKILFGKAFNNDMLKLESDYAEKSLKITDGLRKENWEKDKKSFEDKAKQRAAAEKNLYDKLKDNEEKAFKYSQEHAIANLLGIPEDQLDFAVKGFETIQTQVSGLADAWVESAGRIVDARNNMVQEGEQALQTEIQLAELGFASNVSLKKQELEKAKQLRKEALDDQKKAQKVQLAIDTATQLSSQATAVANYFASTSKIPIVGVLLAIAAATTMFASMQKFRSLAKEQSAVKYETGGWIGGLRHTQGGTNIEAEKGEFVVNRKSAAKHGAMIEAINNDDTITLNKMYINGLKNGVLKTSVSLDDSDDLKAIRKALEKGGGSSYVQGNYRVERNGNTTTKVRLN